MPEGTAASSEAIQQQHAPSRDQHQQTMTPATDLLSASIPQLDRLPPGACAAGVLQGGKPNSGLPSTSSEQLSTPMGRLHNPASLNILGQLFLSVARCRQSSPRKTGSHKLLESHSDSAHWAAVLSEQSIQRSFSMSLMKRSISSSGPCQAPPPS